MANKVLELKINSKDQTESGNVGSFSLQPLERGYGTTIGNAMRRVLLTSIPGAAITHVKIDGVQHEFSTITGVKEDVTEIILNLKKLNLKMNTYDPQTVSLSYEGEGEVTAKDIETNQNVEIVNDHQFIATLSESAKLDIEMTIEMGRGYMPTESRDENNHSIGEILLDSIFSPVVKVNYNVTAARVGRRTDYERLTIEVWTNGTLLPEDAVAYGAKILKDQMTVFVNFDEEEIDSIPIVEEESDEIIGSEDVLFTKIEELDFSARSLNCLEKADIKYLGDLIQLNEEDLLNLENFGKRSLNEVRDVISSYNLRLGEDINKDLYYEQRKLKEDEPSDNSEGNFINET